MAERRASLEEACATVGRDPSTLAVTAGINVCFPDLGEDPELGPDKVLKGSVDEIAAGLKGYATAGVSHVIANLFPLTTDSIGKLAEAAKSAKS
jgi:hypothetical protein